MSYEQYSSEVVIPKSAKQSVKDKAETNTVLSIFKTILSDVAPPFIIEDIFETRTDKVITTVDGINEYKYKVDVKLNKLSGDDNDN